MPRSGTTWLGKIFDSHPETVYRHEPDSWRRLDSIPLFPAPESADHYSTNVRSFLAELTAIRADRVCGKRPLFPKSYASRFGVTLFSGRSLLHKALDRVGLHAEPPVPPLPRPGLPYRLVWKSIESLGRTGVILAALPEAKFVQIVRHPCGYVASVLRGESEKRFGHNQAAGDFDLYRMACDTPQARVHALTESRFRAMEPAERLAWRWVIYNEKAAAESASMPNAKVVIYEELCARPLQVARALFEFCELSWDAQSEQFLKESTSDAKSDYYSVFKDPLESAWRWQSQLDTSTVQKVMAIVAQSPFARPYIEPHDWNRSR
jgi:Sulfotransferase family